MTDDGRGLYTWEAQNRLIRMETTTAATTAGHPYTKLTFRYDWQGRRLERAVWKGGTAASPTFSSRRRWLYDGWNPIVEFDSNEEGTTNTRLKTFTWGLDLSGTLQDAGGVGGLIVQTDVSGSVKRRASYDGNGNIVAWTRSNQSGPDYRCEYDAFGNTLVSEGTSPSEYGFSTKQQDAETGLYYYGYRYYDAVHGRWLNRDPIEEKGGINLYGFVGNNGIAHVDYLGRLGVDLNNMSGFMHWLFGGGETLKVSWSSFDPSETSRNDLKQQWRLENIPKITAECNSMEWNTTKTTTITSPNLDVVYVSDIGWISGWHGKISGYVSGGSGNVDIWKTKKDSKCECLAIADVRLRAEDTSDFNAGDTFIDGLGLEWRDDWFNWARDNTPVGYDYDIYNWEDSYVEWKIEYN